jgi:hypothetical protein
MIFLYIATCFGCSLLGYIYGKYEYTEYRMWMNPRTRLIHLLIFATGATVAWIVSKI